MVGRLRRVAHVCPRPAKRLIRPVELVVVDFRREERGLLASKDGGLVDAAEDGVGCETGRGVVEVKGCVCGGRG